jgi:hypothetical protein
MTRTDYVFAALQARRAATRAAEEIRKLDEAKPSGTKTLRMRPVASRFSLPRALKRSS